MADPLLTSLCSICHISQPKYKCPGCAMVTCSLPCVEKHKKWSECTGKRSQTAYVPPSKLRTAAGIDHDYNFLYSLDRERENAEKLLEEKGLIKRDELYGGDSPDKRGRFPKKGGKRGGPEEGMKYRLADFDIQFFRAPPGLRKGKETNGTRFTKARRRIEWQIEWLIAPAAFPSEWNVTEVAGDQEKLVPQAIRAETKTMDDCPVIHGLSAAMRQFDPLRKVKKTGATEDVSMGGAPTAPTVAGMTHDDLVARFAFFLRQPLPSATSRVGLRPVDPSEIVGENLRGATIFEHPSIYVFEKTDMPPVEWIVEFDREALLEARRLRLEEREAKKKMWERKKIQATGGSVEDPADTTSSEGSDWSEEEEESDVEMS